MGRVQERPALDDALPAPELSVVAAMNSEHRTGAESEASANAPTTAPAPAPASARTSAAAPPQATTDNPWRHLHPARVWPD